eukprot:scaffold10239_cov122-Isochrysis_galbana.AAC.2
MTTMLKAGLDLERLSGSGVRCRVDDFTVPSHLRTCRRPAHLNPSHDAHVLPRDALEVSSAYVRVQRGQIRLLYINDARVRRGCAELHDPSHFVEQNCVLVLNLESPLLLLKLTLAIAPVGTDEFPRRPIVDRRLNIPQPVHVFCVLARLCAMLHGQRGKQRLPVHRPPGGRPW